jgi:DNA-binding response OmpR family regulator
MPKDKKKIIIVDDDLAITEALKLALNFYNFSVFAVTKSSDFFQTFRKVKPDLVILDYFLAGEAGTDLARLAIEEDKTKKLKVIMFSAHPAAREEIGKLRIDAFIAKPFDVDNLIKRINTLLA